MAVQRYRFLTDYRAGDLAWSRGQVTEFEPEYADWLNRDVPGCLEPVDEEAERAALEAEIVAKARAKDEKDAKAAAGAEAKAKAETEAKDAEDAKAAAEAKARAVEQPPADRMQRQAPAKREG